MFIWTTRLLGTPEYFDHDAIKEIEELAKQEADTTNGVTTNGAFGSKVGAGPTNQEL